MNITTFINELFIEFNKFKTFEYFQLSPRLTEETKNKIFTSIKEKEKKTSLVKYNINYKELFDVLVKFDIKPSELTDQEKQQRIKYLRLVKQIITDHSSLIYIGLNNQLNFLQEQEKNQLNVLQQEEKNQYKNLKEEEIIKLINLKQEENIQLNRRLQEEINQMNRLQQEEINQLNKLQQEEINQLDRQLKNKNNNVSIKNFRLDEDLIIIETLLLNIENIQNLIFRIIDLLISEADISKEGKKCPECPTHRTWFVIGGLIIIILIITIIVLLYLYTNKQS